MRQGAFALEPAEDTGGLIAVHLGELTVHQHDVEIGLAERFGKGRLKARDLVRVIGAGLRGAGEAISDDEVARLDVPGGAAGYVRIAAALITATFGGSDSDPLARRGRT